MFPQSTFTGPERAMLHGLQQQALMYFLDNQLTHGLVLDRQRNHGRRSYKGMCSTAATGMGLINIALASSCEHALISHEEACRRVQNSIETALSIRHLYGMMPHFLDAVSLKPVGADAISTIDSSWYVAGAAWAAQFLQNETLIQLARSLCQRIDWKFWSKTVSSPDGVARTLISHGTDSDGKFLPGVWDRLNAETAFMYLMAIGAEESRALPASSWLSLRPFIGTAGDISFISADLGLFVFQYSMLGLGNSTLPAIHGLDLAHECEKGVLANYSACHQLAGTFRTYRRFWGLSAGDGPGSRKGDPDVYRAYAPADSVDGTAHLMATLASIDVWPRLVLENIRAAQESTWRKARGRYGYSNINVDRHWFSRDVVGIDVGAAAMSLENALHNDRIRFIALRLAALNVALERLRQL